MTDRDESEREVMTSLPRSRPARRSPKRAERPVGGAQQAPDDGAVAATDPPAAAATPREQREPRRTPRPKPATVTGKAAPAAEGRRSTPRPRPATVTAAKPDPAPAPAPAEAAPDPPPQPPPARPRRKVPAAGYAAPAKEAGESGSPVTELVTTTMLAAGELAQIGLDVGRSALRSMLDRLPKA